MDDNYVKLPQEDAEGAVPADSQPKGSTASDTLAQKILDSVPPVDDTSVYQRNTAAPAQNGHAAPYQAAQNPYPQQGGTIQYQVPQGNPAPQDGHTIQYQAVQNAYPQQNGYTVQYPAPQGGFARPTGPSAPYQSSQNGYPSQQGGYAAPQQTSQGAYSGQNTYTGPYQAPQGTSGPFPAPGAVPPQNGGPAQPKKKKLKGWMLALIIAGGVLVLAGLAVGGYFLIDSLTHHNVDLSELYHIEIEGYDGYATAQLVQDDWDTNTVFENEEQAALVSTLQGTLDKTEDIKNGDVITATFTYDETYAEQVGVRFQNASFSVTAEGLETADVIDPFENVSLSYEGVSPAGTVTITGGNEDLFYYSIADDRRYFANGDTVTIQVSYDESDVQQAGGIVLESTKEYTVEGLPEYITEKEQLTTQINSLIAESTAAKLTDSLRSNSFSIIYEINSPDYSYLANVSIEDMALQDTYIASRKEVQDWGTYNTIFHLYSMNVTLSQNGNQETFPMYALVSVRNAVVESDGSLRTIDSSDVSFYFSSYFSSDREALYSDEIGSLASSYNIVSLN